MSRTERLKEVTNLLAKGVQYSTPSPVTLLRRFYGLFAASLETFLKREHTQQLLRVFWQSFFTIFNTSFEAYVSFEYSSNQRRACCRACSFAHISRRTPGSPLTANECFTSEYKLICHGTSSSLRIVSLSRLFSTVKM